MVTKSWDNSWITETPWSTSWAKKVTPSTWVLPVHSYVYGVSPGLKISPQPFNCHKKNVTQPSKPWQSVNSSSNTKPAFPISKCSELIKPLGPHPHTRQITVIQPWFSRFPWSLSIVSGHCVKKRSPWARTYVPTNPASLGGWMRQTHILQNFRSRIAKLSCCCAQSYP